jgi:hypothetical protein
MLTGPRPHLGPTNEPYRVQHATLRMELRRRRFGHCGKKACRSSVARAHGAQRPPHRRITHSTAISRTHAGFME